MKQIYGFRISSKNTQLGGSSFILFNKTTANKEESHSMGGITYIYDRMLQSTRSFDEHTVSK